MRLLDGLNMPNPILFHCFQGRSEVPHFSLEQMTQILNRSGQSLHSSHHRRGVPDRPLENSAIQSLAIRGIEHPGRSELIIQIPGYSKLHAAKVHLVGWCWSLGALGWCYRFAPT
jgi:hypothetical protein